MSVPESLQRQVACLRLASDLTRLAGETSDTVLKAQFLRTAAFWSNQADQSAVENGTASRYLD
jgi:hypothetical protein